MRGEKLNMVGGREARPEKGVDILWFAILGLLYIL
jgi:hypothetical protein